MNCPYCGGPSSIVGSHGIGGQETEHVMACCGKRITMSQVRAYDAAVEAKAAEEAAKKVKK